MKLAQVFTVVSLALVASACGEGGPLISTDPGFPAVPTVPSPVPSVSPSASPSPVCKPLDSAWSTSQTPSSQVLGVYLGPPTSGPVYTLDLSSLQNGFNTFTYDSTHVCYYDVTVGSGFYRFESFQGCNPGEIPPGHPVNEQCDYCPLHDSVTHTFNYVKSCNGLSILDPSTNSTVTYH